MSALTELAQTRGRMAPNPVQQALLDLEGKERAALEAVLLNTNYSEREIADALAADGYEGANRHHVNRERAALRRKREGK